MLLKNGPDSWDTARWAAPQLEIHFTAKIDGENDLLMVILTAHKSFTAVPRSVSVECVTQTWKDKNIRWRTHSLCFTLAPHPVIIITDYYQGQSPCWNSTVAALLCKNDSPDSDVITVCFSQHFFTSFGARDRTYMMMFRLWQNALLDKVSKSDLLVLCRPLLLIEKIMLTQVVCTNSQYFSLWLVDSPCAPKNCGTLSISAMATSSA